MGMDTRFLKSSAATFAAVVQTGAAYVITWTSNTPTAGTAATIADGDLVAGTELGQAIQDLTTQHNKSVVDIAALITKQVQLAADNAALKAIIDAGL